MYHSSCTHESTSFLIMNVNTRRDVFVNSISINFRGNIPSRCASYASTADRFNRRLDGENGSSCKPEKCILTHTGAETADPQTMNLVQDVLVEGGGGVSC